jgi:LysM repeat protein
MGIIVAGALFLITLASTIPADFGEEKIVKPISEEKIALESSPSDTPTPTPKPTNHIVTPGDTLQEIAKTYYGDPKYWTILWNDNPWIEDFRVIQTGWELKLRQDVPQQEDLNENLAVLYEEITNPSPTPTLIPEQPQAPERSIGAAGSFDEVYRQAGERFGIPWEILYGLHMVETGLRDGPISNGAGPEGPLQFLPGTWAAYGADGNGDGTADINNAVDAIHGAANYLASHGGVEQGLRSYGNVIDAVYNAARSRGWGG